MFTSHCALISNLPAHRLRSSTVVLLLLEEQPRWILIVVCSSNACYRLSTRHSSIRERIDETTRYPSCIPSIFFNYTSAISRRRRIVDLVAAAAGVLYITDLIKRLLSLDIAQALSTYETVQAPPATVFLHDRQFQIPTECRFTVVLPQKVQVYRACCVISIFLTCFRREAPYLEGSSSAIYRKPYLVSTVMQDQKCSWSLLHTWYRIYR